MDVCVYTQTQVYIHAPIISLKNISKRKLKKYALIYCYLKKIKVKVGLNHEKSDLKGWAKLTWKRTKKDNWLSYTDIFLKTMG